MEKTILQMFATVDKAFGELGKRVEKLYILHQGHGDELTEIEGKLRDANKRIEALEAWTGMAKEHIESLESQVARLQAERVDTILGDDEPEIVLRMPTEPQQDTTPMDAERFGLCAVCAINDDRICGTCEDRVHE